MRAFLLCGLFLDICDHPASIRCFSIFDKKGFSYAFVADGFHSGCV